jgi:lipopolysaccharide transport system ATP-binding protein
MSDVILSIENVSKLYRLGTVGTGTFGGDVQRFWKTKILGQEDPFLKIGQTNDRTSKEKAEFVWALQDINFEVKRGEVLGIIGKNGAGKSTLLKLLSRITSPTTGSIKSAGRMASLLEVGTGFHPELTGRENIFLNGAILGMTKKEIQSKFDEIVDFSGCELYIDTPTKRYSSGMTVRLGFAVAAFLDPEILVVDEVLAVGDAEFQKKAIGKIKDLNIDTSRTILFVSHNMGVINEICDRVIEIRNGKINFDGLTNVGIKKYLSTGIDIKSTNKFVSEIKKTEVAEIILVEIMASSDKEIITFLTDIKVKVLVLINKANELIDFAFSVKSERDNIHLFHYAIYIDDKDNLKTGIYELYIVIPAMLLNAGGYLFDFWLGNGSKGVVGPLYENILHFDVIPEYFDHLVKETPGVIRPRINFFSKHINAPKYENFTIG